MPGQTKTKTAKTTGNENMERARVATPPSRQRGVIPPNTPTPTQRKRSRVTKLRATPRTKIIATKNSILKKSLKPKTLNPKTIHPKSISKYKTIGGNRDTGLSKVNDKNLQIVYTMKKIRDNAMPFNTLKFTKNKQRPLQENIFDIISSDVWDDLPTYGKH